MISPRPLPIPGGAAALRALPALREALEGGTPVIPYAADAPPPAVPGPGGGPYPAGLALAIGTSGSTGAPKLAMLTADALTASAAATHERLGGPGQWLLAMPAHHIAGVQVLIRSLVAGTAPAAMDLSDGFTPSGFAAAALASAASTASGGRRYTAMVPTQLARLLADEEGRRALAGFDAILVGGAATAPSLLARAGEAGITVLTTYGMSETSGGCVYNGEPLSCSRIGSDVDGRLHLGGDTLASGYLGRPDLTAEAFTTDADGHTWFATDDVGHQDASGRWHVDGRLDDLINTGGLKVAPRTVEEALVEHLPGVSECVVVGAPDPRWGEAVCAALVLSEGASDPSVADAREAVRGILPNHALPQRIAVLTALPLRGPGKPDRSKIAAHFRSGA